MGQKVTSLLVEHVLNEEMAKIKAAYGSNYDEGRFAQARQLFVQVAMNDDYYDFLTLAAMDRI